MELRHLRYFLAVAEHGSFHRAAAHLNVAQPSLSRQIRDLEAELGATLLIRSAHGVKLSPAGNALLAEAKWLLPAVELAKSKTKRAAMGQFGLVRVAFNPLIAEFPAATAAFAASRRLSPSVDYRLKMISSEGQIEAIAAGEIDVGVLYHKPPYPPKVEHRDIIVDHYMLVVPSDHPLTKKSEVLLADLQEYDLAFVSSSTLPVIHDEMISSCWRGGLSPRIVVELENELGLLNIVLEGIALSFASSTLARRRPTPGLVFLPVADLDLQLNLAVMWHTDRESPAVASFVDRIFHQLRADGL